MLKFSKNKPVRFMIVAMMVIFSLTGSFIFPVERTEAAVNHPLFYDVDGMKDKVVNYTWAEDAKNALLSAADVWLDRTSNVFSDSTWHGHPSFFICPTHQSKLKYEYQTSIPAQFVCSGVDGEFGTADDHSVSSSDTTVDNWLKIRRGWGVSYFLDHTDAALNLGYAYILTDNTDYADKCAEILSDIAGKYPGYVYHDVNGNTGSSCGPKRGKATCQWLTEAQSFLMRLCLSYDMICASGALTSQQKTSIENMFSDNVNNVLQTTQTDTSTTPKSNWWAYDAAARATYGYLFENTAQQQNARNTFNYLVQNSIKADGFWYEGTIAYHSYSLQALIKVAEAAYRRGSTAHDSSLYNNPAFKKMFDVLLKMAYPNSQVQANNDTAEVPYNLSSAAGNLEVAYAVFGDDKYKNMLNDLYNAGAVRGSEETDSKLFALRMAVCPLPSGTPIEYTDEDLPGVGTMSLRNYIDASNKIMATIDYGEHGGSHGHPDKLSITTFGLGRIWAADLGIGSYQSTLANGWYKTTIGHNAVSLPNTEQTESTGTRDVFGSTKNMDVTMATASSAYSGQGVTTYKRALMLVNNSYILDIFDLGASSTKTYDWSLHCPDSTVSVSGVSLSSQGGALGTSYGYQSVTDLYKGSTTGQWSATFTDGTDSGKKYKITMLPLGTTEVYKAQVPDIGTMPVSRIPKIVARRTRSSGDFKTNVVHEIYDTVSQISSITTDNNSVKITKTNGDQQWLNHYMGSSPAFDMVWKDSSGNLKSIDAVCSNYARAGAVDYLTTTRKADSFNATVNGSSLEITQKPSTLGKVDINAGSHDITSVIVNGSSVDFTKSGNTITYGVLISKVDYSAVSNLYGKTGVQAIEYDVTPFSGGIDGVTGFADSSTSIDAYSDLAMIIRMNVNGYFDVRNGSSYNKLATVNYSGNNTYHVRMVTDLNNRTYDVYVTPPGGLETMIANDYAFRSDAPTTDDLGKISLLSSTGNDQFKIENICSSIAVYSPMDDSYVRDGTGADENYGSDQTLCIKDASTGYNRIAYLKFDFSSLDKDACSYAKLRIYGANNTDSTSVLLKAYGLMNDTWNESGMTWNNGSPNHSYADCEITDKGLSAVYIGQVAVNNIQRYYDIDVSSFVNSNMYDKTVSFALMDIGENSKNLNFNSKEAVSNRPELIITDTN